MQSAAVTPLTPPTPIGELAPFRARDETLARPAELEGEIPAWLRGDLVRTAPAVFDQGAFQARHWFDALGILYGFRIADGRVDYRQRVMTSVVEQQARQGRSPIASFATPITRSFWRRVIEPIPHVTDNTNVNVVALGDQRVALTESHHQWAFDPGTLALTEPVVYDDKLGGRLAMLAHPHLDCERNLVVSLASKIGAGGGIMVYEHAPNSRTRRQVAMLKLPRVPYVHAFGLTPRHAVIFGHPFDVNPLALLWSNRGFIDHFQWRPEQGTKIWLVDRHGGELRTHLAPAGFVFHVVNAFEDGPDTVLDVALFPDASIVDKLRRDALEQDGLPPLSPAIVRYTLTPGREHAKVETLLASGFDFPAINYRRRSGQRHAVSWGARIDPGLRSSIVRLDASGELQRHQGPDLVFGEPTFVARPGADAEDDGVLLTVGSHRSEDRSELRILDAHTMQPLAHASVPLPIALGFHGSFFRDARA